MIFDTFLDRFELRTGCFVVSILYMIFIIFTLHLPLVTEFKLRSIFVLMSTIEKIFESIITLMLIYAVFQVSQFYIYSTVLNTTPFLIEES